MEGRGKPKDGTCAHRDKHAGHTVHRQVTAVAYSVQTAVQHSECITGRGCCVLLLARQKRPTPPARARGDSMWPTTHTYDVKSWQVDEPFSHKEGGKGCSNVCNHDGLVLSLLKLRSAKHKGAEYTR